MAVLTESYTEYLIRYDNEKEYRRSDNEKDARRHDNDNDKGYKSPVKSIPNLSLSYSYSIPAASGNVQAPALSKKEDSCM